MDGNYQTDVPMLTKIIDKLPLIETKQKSSLIATAEFAHLIQVIIERWAKMVFHTLMILKQVKLQ